MLSMEEKVRVLRLLAELERVEQASSIDVANRNRDSQGRFTSEEPEELRLRSIRLVKVRGSYGTYLVKDADELVRLYGVVCLVVTVGLLAVLL